MQRQRRIRDRRSGGEAADPTMLPRPADSPHDPLYVFRRGAAPRYERANEHVRVERPAPVKGELRYSWLLRGLDPDGEPPER